MYLCTEYRGQSTAQHSTGYKIQDTGSFDILLLRIRIQYTSNFASRVLLCSMLYALCSMPMLYALCSLLSALCSMPYALRSIRSVKFMAACLESCFSGDIRKVLYDMITE